MHENPQTTLDQVFLEDRQAQSTAYFELLAMTEPPVAWAYVVWDRLVVALKHKDNLVRAITAQVLCNLAKSDPENRMLRDFDALLEVTRDKRFVTARHCLQAIWKVGAVGQAQRQMLLDGLSLRFAECITEKNGSLTRADILQSLRNLYNQVPDEAIRERALALIETETDPKYRKKYAGLWQTARIC
jgi:hypothetical protein